MYAYANATFLVAQKRYNLEKYKNKDIISCFQAKVIN